MPTPPAVPTLTGDINALALRVRSLELRLNPAAPVPDPVWKPVPLLGSWVAPGGGYPSPEYQVVGNVIRFRGSVKYSSGNMPASVTNMMQAPEFQLNPANISAGASVMLPCIASNTASDAAPFTATSWLNPRASDTSIRHYCSVGTMNLVKLDGVTFSNFY